MFFYINVRISKSYQIVIRFFIADLVLEIFFQMFFLKTFLISFRLR